MFSGLTSPWKGVQRRLSRSISRASEILTGVGPTPIKQFKNAIIDGEEDKAIDLYTASENDKPLYAELPPSKPFPSKKHQSNGDTPLHMSATMGLMKLCVTLLGRGGDPTVLNSKLETALHCVCSQDNNAEARAAIMEILLQWKGGESCEEKVSLNRVDIDGNTAIHLAALNGLVTCVEKLIALGAIISIVNKNNRTCCELADESQHKDLALALELALVFQPVDSSMAEFVAHQHFPYEGVPGRLFLCGETLASHGLNAFIEEAVLIVSRGLLRAHVEKQTIDSSADTNSKLSEHVSDVSAGGDDVPYTELLPSLKARAEILLVAYSWDVVNLLQEYGADPAKVLAAVRLQPLDLPDVSSNTTSHQTSSGEEVSNNPTLEVPNATEGPHNDDSSRNASTEAPMTAVEPVSVLPTDAGGTSAAALEPEAEVCFICGDCMLPSLDVHKFLRGEATQPGSRRLQCDSGHAFCVDCWSGSVTVQVKDNGLGCMPCPGFKCGELLDLRWAPVLLKSDALTEQLLGRRQRLVVDCCAALKTCPIDNCGMVVRVPVQQTSSNHSGSVKHSIPTSSLCDNGHLFCWDCSQPAHSPCSCQQHPTWHQLIKDEIQSVDLKGKGGDDTNVEGADLANALWVAANTKRCPRCQTPIEKDEGCNHMNCRKCRKEFCWICMQDWSLHSDTTGGYFQCNRFVANLKVKDLPAEGGLGELWSEESGNAHAETLRLREKNKRMARFIHHFTRYQAHGESVKMEGRMFKETAKRIRDGLLASLTGGSLKWLQGYQAPNPLLQSTHNASSSPKFHSSEAAMPSMPAVAGEKGPAERAAGRAPHSKFVEAVDESSLNFTFATGFLKEGFEELLKCRCILQWSYPYAYFEFENDDFGDYSRGTPQQRRSRYDRSSSFRSSFDLLQAELEAIVETLSDVVARRRLRAGRDQIVLVTRAAKSKRVELESVIVTYAVSQLTAAERGAATSRSSPASQTAVLSSLRPSNASRTRPEGYHRTRPMSNPGSSRHHRTRDDAARTAGGSGGLLVRSDSDDSTDLAALLYELELASTEEASAAAIMRRSAAPAPNGTPADAESSAAVAMEALLDRQRRLELMQLRMRLIFGSDVPDQATRAGADLPPPIPSDATSLSTGAGQPSHQRVPSTRRIELRQVGNSPGQRMNYTIDPDFEIEESDDEESGTKTSVARLADTSGAIPAVGDGSLLETAHGEESSSEEVDLNPSIDAATTAIRNLLRFGAPEQINQTADALPRTATAAGDSRVQNGGSFNRQEMRLARMTQRAEEEANLNRAILMSLQENQTPDRRRAADGSASATPAASSEPNEADVAMLISMGFTREQSLQALTENRMNVELAANRLLGIDF